jgi:hypothetical protein
MIQRLRLVVLVVVLASGCTHAPPLTPQATTAFYGTRVIQTLDVIRDLAVSASKQTPPVVKPADMRTIVTWHRAAIVTVHTAPAGWRVTVETGLEETLRSLPPETRTLLAPYVALVHAVLAEVS